MMNKSMNWTRIMVLFGSLCFSAFAIAKPVTVVLEVDTTGDPKLQVKTNDAPCGGGAPSATPCIEVEHGYTPYMIFKLPEACMGAGKPEYELTGIRITQVEKVWPSASNPLNELVAKDFKADPETGEVAFWGKNKKTKKKLKFKNGNSHAYTVYYEISATHCDPDSNADDIYLDPEIRNKGKD